MYLADFVHLYPIQLALHVVVYCIVKAFNWNLSRNLLFLFQILHRFETMKRIILQQLPKLQRLQSK